MLTFPKDLEISKPQKNTRNASATAAGDNLRAGQGRGSRSPDRSRGNQQRGGGQRGDRIDRGVPSSNSRDDLRYRDAYRPNRSPSPRGFRGRDEYRGGRDRSPDRYFPARRSRSRSPFGRNGRYRSRSPIARDVDEDAYLPIPRRDARDVPEVQMILVDEVDRTFVAYIEKSFRDRGLRCGILQLPRGVPLDAAIKRQILEGVQAVVKIFRQSQVTGKIPLQVFDRRGGIDNVRFEEYDQLDANIAAELVVRAKSTHFAPVAPPQQYPQQASTYNAPQYGQPPLQQMPSQQMPSQQMPPQQAQSIGGGGGPPNLANLITSMDGPALQKLLATMQQNPRTPQTPQSSQTPQTPNLASLLGNVARQQPPQQQQGGYPYPPTPQQPHHPQPQQHPAYSGAGGAPLNQGFGQNPALANMLANAGANQGMPAQGVGGGQGHAGQQQQNVQNIMEQLAKWKQ